MMLTRLKELALQPRLWMTDVDPIQAFLALPPIPEAARMSSHITAPGDPRRHRKIIPRMILKTVYYKHHLLTGADHHEAEP
jgi:hypothetical protein